MIFAGFPNPVTWVIDEVAGFVVALVRRTRELPAVELGASPRAAVHLLAASRAAARLEGRDFVTPDDVKAVAPAVLEHRVVVRPELWMSEVSSRSIVADLLRSVPTPRTAVRPS